MTALTAFALAAALHAGFQLTVTALVYPALVEVPPDRWTGAHARHSRRIAPLVGVVYAALLASGTATVVDGAGATTWVALALTAGALAVTATLAAPLHGRLGPDDHDLRARLVTVDRARCAFAVTGAVAAAAAALS